VRVALRLIYRAVSFCERVSWRSGSLQRRAWFRRSWHNLGSSCWLVWIDSSNCQVVMYDLRSQGSWWWTLRNCALWAVVFLQFTPVQYLSWDPLWWWTVAGQWLTAPQYLFYWTRQDKSRLLAVQAQKTVYSSFVQLSDQSSWTLCTL